MSSLQSPLSPRTRRASHGAALIMVLSVVSAAAILSWAMLSSASLRSQVDGNAVDSIEASYLAESGVSYALYFIRYPARSPVALTAGPYDSFYGGESNLRLWTDARGTVSIVVTNTAKDTFTIRSSAVIEGTRRVVEADAQLVMKGYTIASAAGFNGSGFSLPAKMTINGPVITAGPLSNESGKISNSPDVVPSGAAVVPSPSQIALLTELNTAYAGGLSTDRTYTYNGATYAAERVPSASIAGTLTTARPSLNPKNVWYSDAALTCTNLNLTGVLVVRGTATVNFNGTNTITAASGMPGLVANKTVELKQTVLSAGKLTVNGTAWINERVFGSGWSRNDGSFTVSGALLMGGTNPTIALTSTSPTTITYTKGSTANVTNLSTVRTVDGVSVLNWRSVE